MNELLPDNFTDEEKAAYKWLLRSGMDRFMLRLDTKRVQADCGNFNSLLSFRKYIELQNERKAN